MRRILLKREMVLVGCANGDVKCFPAIDKPTSESDNAYTLLNVNVRKICGVNCFRNLSKI